MAREIFLTQAFLLIKRDPEEEIQDGFIIPDDQKVKASRGEVMKVGPKCEFIKQGDFALFNKGAGIEISDELTQIHEDDILQYEREVSSE